MIKVLIADEDLDSHELLSDILHINFHEVEVERAHDCNSFLNKISQPDIKYDLILYSSVFLKDQPEMLLQVKNENPDAFARIVLLVDAHESLPENRELKNLPSISKPFSLDHFGEVIRKVFAS
ncbi:hypothetical protein CHISP_0763 [Chitinispirillum alkaliphilum]|nr:hypothetical protein CHISP_0763 [Chitinispirillum alkaliphilum]